jgi:ferritin-like metal-binding protein YciE
MPRQASTKKGTSSGRSSSGRRSGSTASAEKPQSKQTNTMLEKFMLDSLKDMYWAEKHLTKALPKMERAASSEELKQALQDHLTVTEEQVARLEQVFELMGKRPQAKKCEAMEGLSKEAETNIEETEDGTSTRDVALIIACQKVEHYEIASYGGLTQLANTMGLTEVADLLGQTLQEEKEADELLTSIAENNINLQAEREGGEEDSEE